MNPLKKSSLILSVALSCLFVVVGCSNSNFSGSARPSNPSDTSTNPNPGPNPSVNPACKNTSQQMGVQVAFIIDNSSSNTQTDCSNPVLTGNVSGAPQYTCDSATHRENAVLSAYDYLQPSSVSATTPIGKSQFAVASFPRTLQDGYIVQTNWQLIDNANQRAAISQSLAFTRQPMGNTPYGAAVQSMSDIFRVAPVDSRARVAILVTDGFPTDRNGVQVRNAAAALKATGVDIYSIYITNSASLASSQADHLAFLQNMENAAAPGHYYDTSAYPSFSAYTDHILGTNGRQSLLQEMSKQIISIDSAAQLQSTIQSLVQSKSQCI